MAIQTLETLELATLEKSWNNFDVNNIINGGTAVLNSQYALYQIKEWLKTVTGISVRNSCLDASVSASDLITAHTDVVMSATGTWIVLEHTSGYQVMLHAAGSSTVSMTVAPLGGFTTGTSSVNPVATAQSVNPITSSNATRNVWHAGATSDGKCFYVMNFADNVIKSFNGVFEGYLLDSRANCSQYLHLYSASSSFPIVVAALNAASVTESYVTAGGFNASAVSARVPSYSDRFFAYEIGAGVTPAVHFSKIIDIYHAGTGSFLSGDRAVSVAGNAELVTPGTGWFVPWKSGEVMQKL